jgi:hypothetical protein
LLSCPARGPLLLVPESSCGWRYISLYGLISAFPPLYFITLDQRSQITLG